MPMLSRSVCLLALSGLLMCAGVAAQDRSLAPKYGASQKNETEMAADATFIAAMTQQHGGDRKKASQEATERGWLALRGRNPPEAMRRFNQAWLLDPSNGKALWGMGAVEGSQGRVNEALKLFDEAAVFVGNDVDFSADHARTLGMAGTEAKDDALIKKALSRFAEVHRLAPQHTLNLQNWAITLYFTGDYAQAWAKIQLAEATPRHQEVDRGFVAALQQKMPRP